MKTKEECLLRNGVFKNDLNGYSTNVMKAMDEYASQFQQELPKAKDIVKKFIDSDEPDTFIRNEHGVLMYYSHDKQSGINLESYFEDLVQYVYDEISAKSPQPYNPKQP